MITDALPTTFRSARLVYRSVDTVESDKAFFFTHILSDQQNMALSGHNIRKPPTKAGADATFSQLASSDLAVVICLAPEVHRPADEQRAPEQVPGQEAAPAQPIGWLTLGWGGTPASMTHNRSASLGITLAAAFQGNGYGAEAIGWALDWAFGTAGLHRVGLGTASFNARAERLYRRLGFVEEGRTREAVWFEGGWWDLLEFGMLEGEWAAKRRGGTVQGKVKER